MTGLEITIAVLLASNVVTLWWAGRCHMRALSAEIDLSVASSKNGFARTRALLLLKALEWYADPARWKGSAGKHSEAYADKGGRAQRIVTWHQDNPV